MSSSSERKSGLDGYIQSNLDANLSYVSITAEDLNSKKDSPFRGYTGSRSKQSLGMIANQSPIPIIPVETLRF